MKLYNFFFLFLPIILAAQEPNNQRTLRPLIQIADTIFVNVKYNKKDEIKYLNQSHLVHENELTYTIAETYKKNKYWRLFRYREEEEIVNKNKSIINEISEGKQYYFNENGQIIYSYNFVNGEIEEISIGYEYYSNGQLKFIAEIKNDDYWNFKEYRYPDGEEYHFGDFKNGVGTVIHLNEKGEQCLECTMTGKKTIGKILKEEN